MEIKEKIRKFVANFIKTEEFGDDDNILLSTVNSLFAMQLIIFIENEFDIEVDNDELDLNNFNSVNAIADYIAFKTK
ncbi:acyl carrier protein [Ruminococcus flavefaciens]|uniref:acyl carrier protein n=1 Tax=Ruminococcus flavefaciens TaxID=1265 RepID=UPI0004900493|nr:phosphopantetheine-binding protein [Ruminococcus flavefaciens]